MRKKRNFDYQTTSLTAWYMRVPCCLPVVKSEAELWAHTRSVKKYRRTGSIRKGFVVVLMLRVWKIKNTMRELNKMNTKQKNNIDLINPTYRCHWQRLFLWNHLHFQLSGILQHIWAADSSVWRCCVCTDPLTGTLQTARAPVVWWGSLHSTTSVFANGCRGIGEANGDNAMFAFLQVRLHFFN